MRCKNKRDLENIKLSRNLVRMDNIALLQY